MYQKRYVSKIKIFDYKAGDHRRLENWKRLDWSIQGNLIKKLFLNNVITVRIIFILYVLYIKDEISFLKCT